MDGVRVVLVSNIDPDRQTLDANRRGALELELQRLHEDTARTDRAQHASRRGIISACRGEATMALVEQTAGAASVVSAMCDQRFQECRRKICLFRRHV
jgi:hypothetical protein